MLRHAFIPSGGGMGSGMVDLTTGIPQSNTGLLGGVNDLGPFCAARGGAVAATLLAWPLNGPTIVHYYGFAAIFKAGIHHSNQAVISFNGGQSVVTATGATIIGQISGVAVCTLPARLNHNYFVFNDWRGGSGVTTMRLIVVDMTTGFIEYVAASTGGSTVTISPATIGVVTVGTGNPDEGQINAAAFLSQDATVGRPWISHGEIMAWAQNPWSLWYGSDASNIVALAGSKGGAMVDLAGDFAI